MGPPKTGVLPGAPRCPLWGKGTKNILVFKAGDPASNPTRPAGWLDISPTVRTWLISRSNLNFIPIFREDSHPAVAWILVMLVSRAAPGPELGGEEGGARSTLGPREQTQKCVAGPL